MTLGPRIGICDELRSPDNSGIAERHASCASDRGARDDGHRGVPGHLAEDPACHNHQGRRKLAQRYGVHDGTEHIPGQRGPGADLTSPSDRDTFDGPPGDVLVERPDLSIPHDSGHSATVGSVGHIDGFVLADSSDVARSLRSYLTGLSDPGPWQRHTHWRQVDLHRRLPESGELVADPVLSAIQRSPVFRSGRSSEFLRGYPTGQGRLTRH